MAGASHVARGLGSAGLGLVTASRAGVAGVRGEGRSPAWAGLRMVTAGELMLLCDLNGICFGSQWHSTFANFGSLLNGLFEMGFVMHSYEEV